MLSTPLGWDAPSTWARGTCSLPQGLACLRGFSCGWNQHASREQLAAFRMDGLKPPLGLASAFSEPFPVSLLPFFIWCPFGCSFTASLVLRCSTRLATTLLGSVRWVAAVAAGFAPIVLCCVFLPFGDGFGLPGDEATCFTEEILLARFTNHLLW